MEPGKQSSPKSPSDSHPSDSHPAGGSSRQSDGNGLTSGKQRHQHLAERASELLTWIADKHLPLESAQALRQTAEFFSPPSHLDHPSRDFTSLEDLSIALGHIDALSQAADWYLAADLEEKAFEPELGAALKAYADEYRQSLHTQSLQPAKGASASLIDEESTLSKVAAPFLQRAAALDEQLVVELSEARSKTQQAWRVAREQRDSGRVLEPLDELITVTRKVAERFSKLPDYQHRASPYGVLRGIYEPGGVRFGAKTLFEKMTPDVVWLRNQLREKIPADEKIDLQNLQESFGEISDDQYLRLMKSVAHAQGLDPARSTISHTERPLSWGFQAPSIMLLGVGSEIGVIKGITVTKHEAGHLLVYQHANELLHRTPFLRGRSCISTGLDEALAKVHELGVGYSKSFWDGQLTELARYGLTLDHIESKDVVKALSSVSDTPLRVFADPLTYTLMISIRHDLERALINGTLEVSELSEKWNELHRDRLGIEPANDNVGFMQDVHWFMGEFGYFPSYTIGDIASTQLFEAMKRDRGDVDSELARGNAACVTDWLKDHVYPSVGLLPATEIVESATGKPLSSNSFLDYYANLYEDLFEIDLGERPWESGTGDIQV